MVDLLAYGNGSGTPVILPGGLSLTEQEQCCTQVHINREDNLENEDNFKNEGSLKNEEDIKKENNMNYEYDIKNEDNFEFENDLERRMT